MAQETQRGALYQSRGVGWRGRREEVSKGRGCIPMADSCWGLTENRKILQSNYLSIKKINKFFKKKWNLLWGPTACSPRVTRAVCSTAALSVALGALPLWWAGFYGCAGRCGWLLAWLVAKPCLMWRLVAVGKCGGSWHSCLHGLEVLVLLLPCCWAGSGHTFGFTAPGLVGAHWPAEAILGWPTVGLKIPRAGVSLLTVEVMTGCQAADGWASSWHGWLWGLRCLQLVSAGWWVQLDPRVAGWRTQLSWNHCQPTGRQIHVLRSLLTIFSKLFFFFCLKSISLLCIHTQIHTHTNTYKITVQTEKWCEIQASYSCCLPLVLEKCLVGKIEDIDLLQHFMLILP